MTPTVLLALTFALGVGAALMGPAWQAIQPDLVPPHEFGQAVALSSLTFNVGRAIGPALAGALVASAGPGWAFVVNAASFVGVVVVLVWWRPQRTAVRLSTESLPGAVRAGLRYGVNAPALRAILVRTVAFTAPAAAIQALLPTVVRDRLGLGSGGYGILLGVLRRRRRRAPPSCARASTPRCPSDHLVVVSSLIVAAALVVVGLVESAWVIGSALLRRRRGVDDRHGDAQRLDAAGPAVVGAGPWARALPARPRRRHRPRQRAVGHHRRLEHPGRLPRRRRAAARWHRHRAPLAPRSSCTTSTSARPRRRSRSSTSSRMPTTVRCSSPSRTGCPPDAHAEFTTMMRRVERDRRRSGAQEWELYRDLADTDRFLETFVVDTWGEHLRQHERRTRTADVMHAAGPRVRRGRRRGRPPRVGLQRARTRRATDGGRPTGTRAVIVTKRLRGPASSRFAFWVRSFATVAKKRAQMAI